MTTIKDVNGKEISYDASKICDINGDIGPDSPASATDSRRNRVDRVHEIEYVDSKGNAVDNMQILQDMQSGKVNVVALDLDIEATHSGPNHNYCVYYEDSMEKDAESFVNPFKKPMLKNHNDYSGEPMGRIQQAYHGPSELTDERSAIHLKVRVTDQEAIPKFLDGRYATVSIGGTMGTVTCNICGKTILKDGKFKFCGHWRGETYKDQVCYWGAKDITYHEVSTVNNPADDFAQIMKVTVVTDKEEKEGSKKMDGQENNTNTTTTASAATTTPGKAEDAKKKVCDLIDSLLGNAGTTADTNTGSADTAATGTDDGTVQDGTAAAATGTDAQAASDSEEVKDLKQKLEDANKKAEEAENKLKETQDALEKVNKDLKEAQDSVKSMTDMCMTLASANKEMVADGIIAKEKAAGKLKDDAVDSRKQELVAMSMKDLNELASKAVTSDGQRQQAQVSNPGVADRSDDDPAAKGKDSNGSADTDKGTAENKTKRRTVDDYAGDIVSKLFKK